jgi:hypothetical protein
MGTGALGGPTPTNLTGSYGSQELFNTTSGSANTACGMSALYPNTTGGSNTGSGYQALYANTVGSQNSAFGYEALYDNVSGSGNTASGYFALRLNTEGTTQCGAFGLVTLLEVPESINGLFQRGHGLIPISPAAISLPEKCQ